MTIDLDAPLPEEVDLTGLVMSGGKPYILIVVEGEETGEVKLTQAGFDSWQVPAALRELAKLIEAELPPPPAFGPLA